MCNPQLLDEARYTPVLNRSALPAALLRESAGEPGLAGTGSAGDEQVLRTPQPLTGGEGGDLLFIEAAGGFVIDILDASLGDFQPWPSPGAARRTRGSRDRSPRQAR